MSKSTPKPSNENEEIDLGVLFNSIGKGINKLFSFVVDIVKGLLDLLLAMVIFIRKRIAYYSIALLVGVVIGFFYERNSAETYIGTATLEPMFDSARQLYSNVEYLNDLAGQQDSVQLASFFGISTEDAATLKQFEMDPIVSQVRLLQEYNDYNVGLDSIVKEETSYKSYLKKRQKFDNPIHKLTVKSTEANIFPLLLDPLISSVSTVAYFKNRQTITLENLELRDSITQRSITQTDSLLALFESVRIVEANKAFSSGTNVYMSESAEDNAEISLLDRKITLTEQLEAIRKAKLNALNVVDVISSFPNVGYVDKTIYKNKKFQGGLGGIILLTLFYALLYFDSFISKVTKK